jgi:SOS response regulatory protein OraA/RecX
MKALEMTMLPEISAQHFKTANGRAVRFMQQREVHLHQRITLAQKLPKGYLEKLKVNHSHIINMCQKYNYFLGQMDNAHKTSALFTCQPNDAKRV